MPGGNKKAKHPDAIDAEVIEEVGAEEKGGWKKNDWLDDPRTKALLAFAAWQFFRGRKGRR